MVVLFSGGKKGVIRIASVLVENIMFGQVMVTCLYKFGLV